MAEPTTIELRYKYRLRVNKRRAALLQQTFDTCRFVWNQALGRWNDLWELEGCRYRLSDMDAELTDWRGRFDWLSAVPRRPQVQTLRDLDKAISAFFDKGNPTGRPRFKRKGSHNTARWAGGDFRVAGSGLGRRGDRLSVALPSCREEIPVVWSRPLPSTPKSVTIHRDASGRWWASFVVRVPVESTSDTGRNTGLDVGLTTLVTGSAPDADVPNPRFSRREQAMLRRADQRASRGQRDGRVSEKTRLRRARAHSKVARRRYDHHMKTARVIARSFDEIGVEDLKIKNMLANRRLSRAISDAGWGTWVRALDHQRRKIGRTVEYRDPRNTTQTCSDCGTKAKVRLGLKDRVFVCEVCGMVRDRDRNAALNLEPGRVRPGGVMTAVRPVTPRGHWQPERQKPQQLSLL